VTRATNGVTKCFSLIVEFANLDDCSFAVGVAAAVDVVAVVAGVNGTG
jgi:hypothetical protein